MAGHSKWKQIKRKKAITDAKRASSWTKVIREITVAARAVAATRPATHVCVPPSMQPRRQHAGRRTSIGD